MKRITIAIDGYSSSGKSTMAKELAKEIGYIYIDTGAMYRAVTLFSIRQGIITQGGINEAGLRSAIHNIHIEFKLNAATGRPDTWLNGTCVEQEIRGMEVSEWVSPIAALTFVRRELVTRQQAMGAEKGIVMDGRDVGTVIFPQAELKIFVTASPEIRAQRRYDELKAKGENATYKEILENVRKRDMIDTTRAEGPLRKADDALTLDNSNMTTAEQKAWLIEQYNNVTKR